jgi:hypothetical protein
MSEKPCNCIEIIGGQYVPRCECGKPGDLMMATMWCSEKNDEPIRDALKRQLSAKDAELSEAKKKYLLVCAQHGRLVDQVYEEDGETLKHISAEARAAAAYDLLRECFDWGLPEDLKERIDVVIGKKK